MTDLLTTSTDKKTVRAPKGAPSEYPDYRLGTMNRVHRKIRKVLDRSGLEGKKLLPEHLEYLGDRLCGPLSRKDRKVRPSHLHATLTPFLGRTIDRELLDHIARYLSANQIELWDRPAPPARTGNPREPVLCRVERVEAAKTQWDFTLRLLTGRWCGRSVVFSLGRTGVARLGWKLGATNRRDNPLRPAEVPGMITWGTFAYDEPEELRLRRIDGRPHSYVMNHNREHYRELQVPPSQRKQKEPVCT